MYAPSHVNTCATLQISTQGHFISVCVFIPLYLILYTCISYIIIYFVYLYIKKLIKIKMA